MFSGSGIAVRALLLAMSLTLTMVLPLPPGRFVRLCLFRMVRCPLGACSEVPGAPVLRVSYASRVMPWFMEFLSSCHPFGVSLWFFRTWWGSVELLRTSGGRVFCLIARLSPGLGLALAF